MFNHNLTKIIPVNLLLKPVEQSAIVLWLIAIAQFASFPVLNIDNITMQWLLTAPLLMLSALLIAIRKQSILPVIVVFLCGLMAFSVIIEPGIFTTFSIHNSHYLIIASFYSLLFWLLMKRFFNSGYFSQLYKFVTADKDADQLAKDFKSISFLLSAMVMAGSVILCISMGLTYNTNLLVLAAAIVFLFVSEQFVSALTRGVLLPLIVTPLVLSHIDLQAAGLNNGLLYNAVYPAWAVILWFSHNYLSSRYNDTFANKQIATGIWPWYGLLLMVFATVQQAPQSLFNPASLILLIAYLFLMLRNTSLAVISWSLILLSVWLTAFVLFPVEAFEQKIIANAQAYFVLYAQQSLIFSIVLLLASTLWQRYMNPVVMRFGWHKVSFRKPALIISFAIGLLWLLFNTIMAVSLLTPWDDMLFISWLSENTALLVVLLFVVLSICLNNTIVVNLIHYSVLILCLVSWGANQVIPVYLLFAILLMGWLLLPTVSAVFINSMAEKNYLHGVKRYLTFYTDRFDSDMFVKTSVNWVTICFILSVISLLNDLLLSDFNFKSADLFFTLTLLFIASVILAKQQVQGLWRAFSYVFAMGLMVSIRIMIMGTAAVNEFDTIGLFVVTFGYYFLTQKLHLKSSSEHGHTIAGLLPLSTLLTIPWSMGSLHSSVTLLVLGVFYLLVENNNRLLHYAAFVFINLAVYLWMPMLSDHTGLLLFYIIPVVLSLFLLTHLHRDEMSIRLKNKVHLMALSVFYVIIAADVFINDTLLVFAMGLLFAFAGIIYGISKKIRVFLYVGVSFLVVIILGQLIMFYPEGRLARALILMVSGALITGSMIFFNIKREKLLARIRLFRADLDAWD